MGGEIRILIQLHYLASRTFNIVAVGMKEETQSDKSLEITWRVIASGMAK